MGRGMVKAAARAGRASRLSTRIFKLYEGVICGGRGECAWAGVGIRISRSIKGWVGVCGNKMRAPCVCRRRSVYSRSTPAAAGHRQSLWGVRCVARRSVVWRSNRLDRPIDAIDRSIDRSQRGGTKTRAPTPPYRVWTCWRKERNKSIQVTPLSAEGRISSTLLQRRLAGRRD